VRMARIIPVRQTTRLAMLHSSSLAMSIAPLVAAAVVSRTRSAPAASPQNCCRTDRVSLAGSLPYHESPPAFWLAVLLASWEYSNRGSAKGLHEGSRHSTGTPICELNAVRLDIRDAASSMYLDTFSSATSVSLGHNCRAAAPPTEYARVQQFERANVGLAPGRAFVPNHGVGDLVADPVDRVERKSGLLEDYRNGAAALAVLAGKIRTPTRGVLRLDGRRLSREIDPSLNGHEFHNAPCFGRERSNVVLPSIIQLAESIFAASRREERSRVRHGNPARLSTRQHAHGSLQ